VKAFGRRMFFWGLLIASPLCVCAQGGGARRGMDFFSFLIQPKFVAMLLIGLVVWFLLVFRRMVRSVKVVLLLLSTMMFGFLGNIPGEIFSSFAMHPSPMCAATKPLLYGFGIPFLVTVAVIFFLTLVGPKLFCGWICPVGAIQELIAMVADKTGIRRLRFSFRLAFIVRLGLFLAFIFLSATAILHTTIQGRVFALSFYDHINAFHGLEFQLESSFFDTLLHYLPFLLTVILAFRYYRPFCHFVCPMGLLAHWLEQAAVYRIRLRKSDCTDCRLCVAKSPCTAVHDILQITELRPDCYACNVCVESCADGALDFGVKRVVDGKARN